MITEQEEEPPYSRRFILILITIATFLNPFTGTAVNLALPAIGAEFSADAATLAWITSAYLLASVIFLLPAGRLGDSRGRVTVFMTGIVVYTVGSLLSVFTPTIGMLLLFRFIQGVGGAMIYANSVALITYLYPPGERGYAIGLNTTAVYAGLSLGPFLGGALTQFFGWRSTFIVTVLIAAPVLVYARIFPAFLNERRQEHFDVPGLILSSALILCLFLGLARATTPGGIALLVVALGLGVIFYQVERRHPSPLLPVSLRRCSRDGALSRLLLWPCHPLGDDVDHRARRAPGCPGRRGRVFFVSEYLRRHGERGEAPLRERIRDGCDDAVTWDDDGYGNDTCGLCVHAGVDRCHAGDIPGVPPKREPDTPGICGPLTLRRLSLPEKERVRVWQHLFERPAPGSLREFVTLAAITA
jgi:hypothetical protein